MSKRSTRFTIQTLSGDRWEIKQEAPIEADAVDSAEGLVALNKYDGVRVVREWYRADGTFTEKEIYSRRMHSAQRAEEERAKNARATLGAVESGPLCTTVDAILGLESRLLIGRLLRKYLDEEGLTPTELLHTFNHGRKLTDTDLYIKAVARVAHLQAGSAGSAADAREDELYALLHDLNERAREAEADKALWKTSFDDFPGLMQTVESRAANNPERQAYLARVAMSRNLVAVRSWKAKLERLLPLINRGAPAAHLAVIDDFVADIIAIPEAVQELIGPQPNLGAALQSLIVMCHGVTDHKASKGWTDVAMTLTRQFGANRLLQSRQVLMERVRRQIDSGQPLARNDPGKEEEAFRNLLAALVNEDGIVGGSPMAEAISRHYTRRFTGGVTETRRRAVNALAEMLSDRGLRIRYLLAIAETDFGSPFAAEIGQRILKMVREAPDIHHFCYYRLPAARKMTAISSLMRRVRENIGLSMDIGLTIFARLDQLLVDFMEMEQVISKIDDPGHSLASRTLRLVRFCGSGVLVESKALMHARERVLERLRRPHFLDEYTEGSPDQEARNAAVRELRTALLEAGFSLSL